MTKVVSVEKWLGHDGVSSILGEIVTIKVDAAAPEGGGCPQHGFGSRRG